jgi:hypothetical protein
MENENWGSQYDPETVHAMDISRLTPRKKKCCQTVNRQFYLQVLKSVKERVCSARSEVFQAKWMQYHDNATRHTATSVEEFLERKPGHGSKLSSLFFRSCSV